MIVITGDPPNRILGTRRTHTFRWLTSAASTRQMRLLFVQPKNVVYKDGVPIKVMGHKLSHDEASWKPTVVHVVNPVWLDFMYLQDLKRHRSDYKRLRNAILRSGVRCVNPVLPGKDIVYNILSHADLGPGRIPITRVVKNSGDVSAFLRQHHVGWFKPSFGSGGRNIARIEQRAENEFLIYSDSLRHRRVQKRLTLNGLSQFVNTELKYRKYLIQEEVDLPQLRDGHRVDFRVTVQRDQRGEWVVTATTLRRSGEGTMVTNHHGGGIARTIHSTEAALWMESAHLSDRDRLLVETTALKAARALHKVYPDLAYLGVDTAPTKEGRCYVYDCNSRPGRDILTEAEIQLLIDRLMSFLLFANRSENIQR